MLQFKSFLNESAKTDAEMNDISQPVQAGIPKTLHDFLWHLSSPNPSGHGIGPKYSEEQHEKFQLLENIDVLLKQYIQEAKDEEKEDVHPLLKTSKALDLEHPHHPLNIVRRGIEAENRYREDANKKEDERIKKEKETGKRQEKVLKNTQERISDGVHAAFAEHEIEHNPNSTNEEKQNAKKERERKLKESQEHFKNFMHKEGGHSLSGKRQMMSQNGKTASSKGVGRNTIGLSLAPHSIGSHDPTGKVSHTGREWDVCPHASSECKKNCLGITAGGNRQYPVAALKGKLLRQRYLVEHPEHAVRLMSHEIKENEKFTNDHQSIHDDKGNVVGVRHKKTGKITLESPVEKQNTGDKEDDKKSNTQKKNEEIEKVKKHLESGHYHTKNLESGVRLNVTSDIPWHKLGGGKIFKHHPHTKFYDYTKNHKNAQDKNLPTNYKLALSHTGDNHEESNSHHAVETLRKGGVVAMVYKRGKNHATPRRVKVIGSKEGEDEWHVANGDDDDNIDQRHDSAAEHHEDIARKHRELAHKATTTAERDEHLKNEAKHKGIAKEYKDKKRGVVSGLRLKGVTNDEAGNFANHVDDDGTLWIHEHPHVKEHKISMPKSTKG